MNKAIVIILSLLIMGIVLNKFLYFGAEPDTQVIEITGGYYQHCDSGNIFYRRNGVDIVVFGGQARNIKFKDKKIIFNDEVGFKCISLGEQSFAFQLMKNEDTTGLRKFVSCN